MYSYKERIRAVKLYLKPGRAADRLGLSIRQVERLVSRFIPWYF
ncbi:TPA: helix-turn-helix domain-containing protein [Burkholderia territorii]|nr:helix-turn-helix domain-containing protein [Burkholderia territorii]HDR8861805.1 helix-turn-helix domain-containing protein [Burkholderia territorii]HDR8867909.1 helix-turn-helix domain-containing protein [Burkholderia territorii]HDR8874125.1 helix-turn-helix domain-containing protein [Burkholderia territorii]HDR8880369.1 helix-turn-helix domain-containing protein [Burkholderia territorii]HDR8886604.1 helix-turn-helix domain-containing protein [Burkholderia territorii]